MMEMCVDFEGSDMSKFFGLFKCFSFSTTATGFFFSQNFFFLFNIYISSCPLGEEELSFRWVKKDRIAEEGIFLENNYKI